MESIGYCTLADLNELGVTEADATELMNMAQFAMG